MKKYIFLFTLLLTLNVFADDNQEPQIETLFGSNDYKIGGYIAYEMKFSDFNKEFGLLTGGRLGIIFNSSFAVGLAGYGLNTNHSVIIPSSDMLDLNNGYGGIFLEYINSPNKLVHFTIHSLIGAGGVKIEGKTYPTFNKIISRSAYFIFEPGISAEVNLLRYLRLGVGASYRLVTGLDNVYVDNNSDRKSVV